MKHLLHKLVHQHTQYAGLAYRSQWDPLIGCVLSYHNRMRGSNVHPFMANMRQVLDAYPEIMLAPRNVHAGLFMAQQRMNIEQLSVLGESFKDERHHAYAVFYGEHNAYEWVEGEEFHFVPYYGGTFFLVNTVLGMCQVEVIMNLHPDWDGWFHIQGKNVSDIVSDMKQTALDHLQAGIFCL